MHRTFSLSTSLNSFGSIMEGRSYDGDTSLRYRFGFNTQVKDDEVYGAGNCMSAEFWEYDSRLGRRWNTDPKYDYYLSPYTCLINNPVLIIDPYGDKVKIEKGEGVTPKQHNRMKASILISRIFSKSFRKMYNDLDDDEDHTFVIWSQTKGNSECQKIWEVGKGRVEIYMNVRFQLFKEVPHELGHAWRMLNGIDQKPNVVELPSWPAYDWKEPKKIRDLKISNWQKEYDKAFGDNIKNTSETREKAELGAMHIQNIVVSELKRKIPFLKIEIQTVYGIGPGAEPATSIHGNPTYNKVLVEYKSKYELDYYNKNLNLNKEHNLKK